MMLVHYLPRRNRTPEISSISYDDVSLDAVSPSLTTRLRM